MPYFAGMLLIMMHVVMGMPAAAAFMAVLMGVFSLFLVGMTATASLMAVIVVMFSLFLMGMTSVSSPGEKAKGKCVTSITPQTSAFGTFPC